MCLGSSDLTRYNMGYVCLMASTCDKNGLYNKAAVAMIREMRKDLMRLGFGPFNFWRQMTGGAHGTACQILLATIYLGFFRATHLQLHFFTFMFIVGSCQALSHGVFALLPVCDTISMYGFTSWVRSTDTQKDQYAGNAVKGRASATIWHGGY